MYLLWRQYYKQFPEWLFNYTVFTFRMKEEKNKFCISFVRRTYVKYFFC